MKTGLVSAIAVAVLFLASLLYWQSRTPEATAPIADSQPHVASPEPPLMLSAEEVDPSGVARAHAAPPTVQSPVLESDLASPPPAVGAAVASVGESAPGKYGPADGVDDGVFAAKYAGMGADARRDAKEALQALLAGGREHEHGKGPALTEKQHMEYKRELEWLAEHDSP